MQCRTLAPGLISFYDGCSNIKILMEYGFGSRGEFFCNQYRYSFLIKQMQQNPGSVQFFSNTILTLSIIIVLSVLGQKNLYITVFIVHIALRDLKKKLNLKQLVQLQVLQMNATIFHCTTPFLCVLLHKNTSFIKWAFSRGFFIWVFAIKCCF